MRRVRLLLRLAVVGAVLAGVCIAACAPLRAYRTTYIPPETEEHVDCTPLADGGALAGCATLMTERTTGYDLHFAEFDDQGYPFPDGLPDSQPGIQAEQFLDSVRSYADENGRRLPSDSKGRGSGGVSVVVFVHGWKHTAETDDSNVKAFRSLLQGLSNIEDRTHCDRKVIGLYVGWRGAGTRLPSTLESITFWTRKSAALNVSQGSIRNVVSSLRAIEDLNNVRWHEIVASAQEDREVDAREPANTCAKRMRLTIVGHSFGGLIVHSALSQAMIRDMAELRERIIAGRKAATDRDPPLSREGDLVVLINPAIEASRFDPLYRIARQTATVNYHSPLFISITSTDDWATRYAFPVGRRLRSLFDQHPDGAAGERRATLQTIGQDDAYITHTLRAREQGEATAPVEPRCDEVVGKPFQERFDLEAGMLREFETSLGDSRDGNRPHVFPRVFCARDDKRTPATTVGRALILDKASAQTNLNSPVWNIRTSAPILNDHGDILNVKMIDFLRQMYAEAANPQMARFPMLENEVVAGTWDQRGSFSRARTVDDRTER